jgi:hypothetical protein
VLNKNGLLPKSLFTLSKTFLIHLRLVPGALKTRPPGSNFKALIFHFAKIDKQKRFNDRSKGFGQQPEKN